MMSSKGEDGGKLEGDKKHSQVQLLPRYVVQGNRSDKHTQRGYKVNNKDELQEFLRAPYRFEQLPHQKKSKDADN